MQTLTIKDGDLLQATKQIKVHIKRDYLNIPVNEQHCGNVPENRRVNEYYGGFYYIIQENEFFNFRTSNDYDLSHFTLKCGVGFSIDCGNPLYFIDKHNIIIEKYV